MARIIGMVALFLGTLALAGCAGPYGYGGLGGLGDFGSYGAAYPQSYGSAPLPIPLPMDSGYAGGYTAAVPYYAPQPYAYAQPYGYDYGNGASVYPPEVQSDSNGRHRNHWANAEAERRLHHQMDRIQQGLDSGQLTPQEHRRLQAEQRHLRSTLERMQADGRLSPRESARINQMLDRSSRDIARFNHNGARTPASPDASASSTGPTTGPRGHRGPGSVVQPGQPGQGPSAWQGRGGRFQPRNGPVAQTGPANGPGFQPPPRMMPGQPPTASGPRFQSRPMPPRPQAVRPAPAPRSQPNAGPGFRRISSANGG